MEIKYLINYQYRTRQGIEDYQTEVLTREEADDVADNLEMEGYENIIIEKIRI